MNIETLKALRKLGFFNFTNDISGNILGILENDDEFEDMIDDEFTTLGLLGFIKKFFIEKYNMLGNTYSNASGYLYEIHDAVGGTHRIDSGFIGDDEESGTFTTNLLAQEALIEKLIQEATK